MGQLYDKCRSLIGENYEIVKDSMGKASGGDADGVFFVFDQPIEVEINLEEPFLFGLKKKETVLGVFYSDNRICTADCIAITRYDGVIFRSLPHYSEDLHKKMNEKLLELKGKGRLTGFRWNEADGVGFENAFHIAKEDFTNMPYIKQWKEMKDKHPNAIILFRCGDFYKTYGDDAEKVARVCGITLSTWGRNPIKARADFSHYALDTYLPKLVRAGYRIAICDLIEDSKLTKKLVKRGITELVNPQSETGSCSPNHLKDVRYGIAEQVSPDNGFLDEDGVLRHTMSRDKIEALYRQLDNFIADSTRQESEEHKAAILEIKGWLHKRTQG